MKRAFTVTTIVAICHPLERIRKRYVLPKYRLILTESLITLYYKTFYETSLIARSADVLFDNELAQLGSLQELLLFIPPSVAVSLVTLIIHLNIVSQNNTTNK